MRKNRHSIAREVDVSSGVLMGVLIVPMLISLVVMLVYASSYSESTSRMERVAALKPVVGTQIPEDLWFIIAGRETFDTTGMYATIQSVDDTLQDLIAKSADAADLELAVARRTMGTLASYVEQVERDMASGEPIVKSEATLEEVRSVSLLVNNMLENYIMKEVERVARTNGRIGDIVAASVAVEVVLLLVALAISVLMRRRMARSIHEPIEQLEQVADLLAGGNLQARAPSTDVEELIDLTDRINVMADKLESLFEQNQREQENLKKAELRTLQAQINPHFLYNTLDTILWQAEAGHSGDIIYLTKALSDFFRISLSSGADWIPVAQEMRHLKAYLAIQKIRYRDILDYLIVVPEEIGGCYILKLLLQPLVENALYHGIKHKRGGGKITITGHREEGHLCFSVEDTGRGMDAVRLQQVRDSLNDPETQRPQSPPDHAGSGFGLHNVHQRICLHYNQLDGLHIESDAGGTRVSFRVPIRGGATDSV